MASSRIDAFVLKDCLATWLTFVGKSDFMAQRLKRAKKKPSRIVPILIAAAIVVVVLTASGFAYAASQETHDPFCGSCHTQPESTFLQQTTAPAVSLASYHASQKTRCIDCHSGQGILGRVQAELLGARNAFLWNTGTAVQPAVQTVPIGDGNCLKCHQQVTQRGYAPQAQITVPGVRAGRGGGEGGNNHWHENLARWQATSATAGTCVSCHAGHSTSGNAQSGFMDQNVQAVCNACHQVLRRGEG
jgi:predicted CXXCH cytochrome family protein